MTTNPRHTKNYVGPFPCKGARPVDFVRDASPNNPRLTPTQAAWMRENKPLYYTGIAINDLPHLPQELRFV